jgi:hypothetical protein
MRRTDKEYQKISASITSDITGRFVYGLESKFMSDNGLPVTYLIKEFRPQSKLSLINICVIANEVIMRRIFDQHGILLDEKMTTNINQVSAAGEGAFFTSFLMYGGSEE